MQHFIVKPWLHLRHLPIDAMPKHSLSEIDGQPTKRAKSSATPIEVPATRFEIHYPVMEASAKKKLGKAARIENDKLEKNAELVISPFQAVHDTRTGWLNRYISVTPAKEWSAMKKYNNFIRESIPDPTQTSYVRTDSHGIVQGITFRHQDYIFVLPDTAQVKKSAGVNNGEHNFWVARILQIRAEDPQHVYALVLPLSP